MVPIALLVLLMLKIQQDFYLGASMKTTKYDRHSSIWVYSNFQEMHKQMQREFETFLPIILWTKDRYLGNGKNAEDFRDYNLM